MLYSPVKVLSPADSSDLLAAMEKLFEIQR